MKILVIVGIISLLFLMYKMIKGYRNESSEFYSNDDFGDKLCEWLGIDKE